MTPQFTPAQLAASEWIQANWHHGLCLVGADSNYVAFHAFCAGASSAYKDAAEMVAKTAQAAQPK